MKSANAYGSAELARPRSRSAARSRAATAPASRAGRAGAARRANGWSGGSASSRWASSSASCSGKSSGARLAAVALQRDTVVIGSVPRRAADAQVDRGPGRGRAQQAEALGDLERAVVRAASRRRCRRGCARRRRRDRPDQHLGRRPGEHRAAVVLGDPVAVVAQLVGEPGEVERVRSAWRPSSPRRSGTGRGRSSAHRASHGRAREASGPARRIPVRWSSSASIPAPPTPATASSPATAGAWSRSTAASSRPPPGADPGARLADDPRARRRRCSTSTSPTALAVEDLYFGANARSAFAVGQARGVVILAAGQRGVPCFSYTPQQVKGAVCGSGRAGKGQVQRMVQALLALAELPRPDHAADALAVAICHANGAPLRAALGGGGMIALARRRGRRAPRRPRRRRLRRRRLPARRVGRDAAPRPGGRARPATLHTHLIVRDDALPLYGFATEAERDLFLLLIGVQSVGPKVALAVLSRRHPARAAGRRRGGRHRAPAGRARDRQAHRGADRRRAAREGRRGARGRPDRGHRAATTRGCSRATASSASASAATEAEQLLDGAPRATRPRT